MMVQIQFTLFVAAVVFYVLAWAASLARIIFKKEFFSPIAYTLALVGLLIHTGSLIIRSIAINHLPLFGTYENSQVAGWVIVFFTLIIYRRYPHLRKLSVVTFLWSVLLVLWSLKFNRHLIPLTISEQSLWVDFHVLFAWMAFGSFFTAWALALFYLMKKSNQIGIGLEPEEISELQLKFLFFGFITYTIMIALGSVYEYLLFGKWWQWDIVETISLILWILYGLILHLKLFYKNKDKLAAWLTIFTPLGLFISYLGLTSLKVLTFHNFDLGF